MEEATGTQLGVIWDELSPDSKLSIMREVVAIESKMLSVSFSQYVYFHIHPDVQNLICFSSAMAAYILRVMQLKVQSPPNSPTRLHQNSKSIYTRRSVLGPLLTGAFGRKSVLQWTSPGVPVSVAIRPYNDSTG
jgi:hypothetical protein